MTLQEKDPQPYLIEETLLVKECAQRIVWHHRQALWNSVELLSCASTSTMYVFSVPVVYHILLGNKGNFHISDFSPSMALTQSSVFE
jgi:hypothetical protein